MRKYRNDLRAKYLRSILSYNRRTGIFRWKVARKGIRRADIAGDMRNGVRRRIGIDGHRYVCNRLAWLYVTGRWPLAEIDHKNRDRTDDRFANLRPATHSENLRNVGIKRNNTSGIKGVSWDKSRRKWLVTISVRGRQRNLGRFNSRSKAKSVYRIAARKLHREFARVA